MDDLTITALAPYGATAFQIGIVPPTVLAPDRSGAPQAPPGSPTGPFQPLIGLTTIPVRSDGVPDRVWTVVRAPNAVQRTSPGLLGTDLSLIPAVRGYAGLVWSYTRLRGEDYQLIQNLYSQLVLTRAGGRVRIRWADEFQGAVTEASAIWSPPPSVSVDVAGITGWQLTFTDLGREDAAPPFAVTG